MVALILVLFAACLGKIVEYRLGANFGQIFYDHSYNNNHGVNGNSHSTTDMDTLPTDRGAFFEEDTKAITVPSNTLVSTALTLAQPFTVLCWVMSENQDGVVFKRYSSTSSSSNYISVKRVKSGKKIFIEGSQSGTPRSNLGSTTDSMKDSNIQLEMWNMVALVVTGVNVYGYVNNVLEASFTFPSSYSESGTYLMTIGSASATENANKGFYWYFVILNNDASGQSNYISGSSTNCLTSSCSSNSCNPSVVIPGYQSGCISENVLENQHANGQGCPAGSEYGCTYLATLDCDSCSCGSCTQTSGVNSCWCPSTCNATAYSCICPSTVTGWTQCCDSSCTACVSGTSSTCSACVATHATPDGTSGCKCLDGYYGTKPLSYSTSCTACYTECATCNATDVCLTCKSSHATPDDAIGCNCDDGYYGTKPLTLASSCTACYSECATCDRANICLTCISLNATTSLTLGCDCVDGFYGTKPLNSENSCIACYEECATCSAANLCTSCVSDNAVLNDTIGCDCDDGFYGTKPLNTLNSCVACYDECATCNQADKCLTCESGHASPNETIGCDCDDGYYGTKPLDSANSCTACYSECATCDRADICLTCVSANASLNATIGCNCDDGFYGTKPLDSASSCIACHEECVLCSEANKCLTCKSDNTVPSDSQGCDCIDGYYPVRPLTTITSCVECYEECKTCETANVCLTCVSANATQSDTLGCYCDDGFYALGTLNETDSCLSCYAECATCNQSSICLTCISSNANPNDTEGCYCVDGYFSNGPLTEINSCLSCNDDCSTCENADQCLTCIDGHAYPDNSTGCVCEDGYFGTSPLDQVDSCQACYQDCKTCDQESICLTCISNNSAPDPDLVQGCKCVDGYYTEGNLTAVDSCLECLIECTTCSDNSTCDTCISLNSSPSPGGCSCNIGYYSESPLTSADSCIQCYSECQSCNQSSICLTCTDPNSFPDESIGCTCNPGYYKDNAGVCQACMPICSTCATGTTCIQCKDENALFSDGICTCQDEYYFDANTNLCSPCNFNCSTCEDANTCLTCKTKYANAEDIGCDCPEESTLTGDKCVCSDNFFMNRNLEKVYECLPCHESCETCKASSRYSCIECKGELQMDLSDNTCSVCPDGKYNNDSVCSDCYEQCATCNNYDFCLSCVSDLREPNPVTGFCQKKCLIGRVNINDVCVKCPTALCDKCDEALNCTKCTENAEFNSSECICNKGFEVINNNCHAKYFTGKLRVSSLNNLKLKFTELTEDELSSDDFEVAVDGNISFTWKLKVKTNKVYEFFMDYKDSIGSDIYANVTVLKEFVLSANNSQLEKYFYRGKLNEDEEVPQSVRDATVISGTLSKTLVGASLAMAVLAGPGSAWALINTIEIIAYMPINSNPLTPSVKSFLTSLGDIKVVPNAMPYIFHPKTTRSPYNEAFNYGIESSVFWVNFGPTLTIFVFFIVAWPFVYILSKFSLGRFTINVFKILGNYKYSFFIRFWMQAYLDIGFYSFIQLRSPVNSFNAGFFQVASAVAAVITFFLTPPFVLLSTYLSYSKISDANNDIFKRKFGSLFAEFKNNKGFLSVQFYFVFFGRRLAYVLSQVYLNNHVLYQQGLNITLSIVQTVYLLYFRPFKEFTVLLTNTIGEIVILIVFSICVFFYTDISTSTSQKLEITVIFTVIGGICAQVLVMIYSFYEALKTLFYEIERKRAMSLMRANKNSIS